MKKLVIHIGMGKSASTTIQKSVLGHSTAPVSIGRHKPAVCPALPPFWWRGLVSPREQDVEQTKKILLEKYFTKTNLVVISDEVFLPQQFFWKISCRILTGSQSRLLCYGLLEILPIFLSPCTTTVCVREFMPLVSRG